MGDLPLTETTAQLTDVTSGANSSGAYLQNEMNVCISSDGNTVVNGPLTVGMALTPSVQFLLPPNQVILAPGDADSFTIEFYAGQKPSTCGTVYSSGPTTAGIWQAAVGYAWTTPASLLPQAEGGSVTVTITNNFSA